MVGAGAFSGCPRHRRLKLLILRLTPLGLFLPLDFTLGLAAISIKFLRSHALRRYGAYGRLCGQAAAQHSHRLYERHILAGLLGLLGRPLSSECGSPRVPSTVRGTQVSTE